MATDPQFLETVKKQKMLTKASSREFLAQQEATKRSRQELPFREMKSKAELVSAGGYALSSKVQAVKAGMDFADYAKPFIVGAIILFFFIGPGLATVLNIIQAMTWYYWVGAIFLAILFWRMR